MLKFEGMTKYVAIFIIFISFLVHLNDNFFHFNLIDLDFFSQTSKILNQKQIRNFDLQVVKVIDGDTLRVQKRDGSNFTDGKNEETIRLIGVNTPETVDPRRPVECFGKEASTYTKNLVKGEMVFLETDDSQQQYDKYDRLLAYVYVQTSGLEGSNYFMLNQKLIEDGYAYEYTYNTPYKYQEIFKEAETKSKNQGLGLWNLNSCNGLKIPVASPPEI